MAAPADKHIGDLNGKWVMVCSPLQYQNPRYRPEAHTSQNKAQSDSVDPALQLQSVGWMTRKIIGLATLTLHVKQFVAPPSPPADPANPPVTHIEIEQTGTGGMKGTTEKRCLDYTFRDHSDWIFGHVKGQSRFIKTEEIDDEFLKKGWLEGEEEAKGPNGETHIISHVESYDNGWTATQIWGFKNINGERKYVRNVVVKKGAERVEIQLVYDYLGSD
ncbi:uncharacterized protein CTHT_0053430 [Thermochaetoides thermophila DSM 1495]|uniref:Lipocalin-like domain-containing protein n=1 Tax=Chaetomium thermophilum (strain DSM 1495 / CBS 144.50 / IMI 039719) TaxID=759272 RepID=G0SDY3_CHATD|nr:hypothetical protein CTHT_0053430 [Thermochaetoides thermophila DSM 1495]EGS18734.1 hypothetical protein CTHT_0053430 [Thermochaetoides thermophila DSM 1495]